jgi:hypothetical protein
LWQATPTFQKTPSIAEYILQLNGAQDRAEQNVYSTFGLGGSLKLVCCTAVFRRWQNAITAIIYNCCIAWAFKLHMCIVVVGFAEDRAPMDFLSWACEAAIRQGLLWLCSGGESGEDAIPFGARSPHLLADSTSSGGVPILWKPTSCGEVEPPRLQYWHASAGKNTSHEAGSWVSLQCLAWPRETLIMCNLDADNMITNDFLTFGMSTFATRRLVRGVVVCAGHNTSPGCVGRMMYRHVDFEEVGGYDVEGLHGTGYQDVDLRDRLRCLQCLADGEGAPIGGWMNRRTVQIGQAVYLTPWNKVGGALPNDTDNYKEDRNAAKIAHVAQPPFPNNQLSWGSMNEKNRELCKARLKDGAIRRNVHTPVRVAWWVLLPNMSGGVREDWSPTESFAHGSASLAMQQLDSLQRLGARPVPKLQSRKVAREEEEANKGIAAVCEPPRMRDEPSRGEAEPPQHEPLKRGGAPSTSTTGTQLGLSVAATGSQAPSATPSEITGPGPQLVTLVQRLPQVTARVVKLYVFGLVRAKYVKATSNTSAA